MVARVAVTPLMGSIVAIEGAASVEAAGATHPLQLPSKYRPWPLFPFPTAMLLDKTPVKAGHLASSFSLVRTSSV